MRSRTWRVWRFLSQCCGRIISVIGETRRSPIRFEFEPAKLVAAATVFASANLPELTTLKMAKLLYFADKRHFLRHGRPITGDAYFGMEHGPVPSLAYDVLKGAEGRGSSRVWVDTEPLFRRYLDVVTPSGKNSEFHARREADTDQLSKSDLEILRTVIHELGSKTGRELRQLAHKEPDFAGIEKEIGPNRKRVAMPYETFFEGQSSEETLAIKTLVLAEQEDREFFERL